MFFMDLFYLILKKKMTSYILWTEKRIEYNNNSNIFMRETHI